MEMKIRLPGWSDLSPKEYRIKTDAERRQYRQRLDMLCPSKDLQHEARQISKDINIACSKCIYYCSNEEETCRIPHTEAYMDVLGINPCYEGALLYLCKEMERKQQESGATFNEIEKMLKDQRTVIYDTLVTIKALTDIIIGLASRGKSSSKAILIEACMMNEKTQEIIDDLFPDYEDEDEFDEECDYAPDYDEDDEDDDYFDENYDFDYDDNDE